MLRGGLVYSAALRQVQKSTPGPGSHTGGVYHFGKESGGAEENGPLLPAGFAATAHLVARNALKTEHRRHHREQEAHMPITLESTRSRHLDATSPLLDESCSPTQPIQTATPLYCASTSNKPSTKCEHSGRQSRRGAKARFTRSGQTPQIF